MNLTYSASLNKRVGFAVFATVLLFSGCSIYKPRVSFPKTYRSEMIKDVSQPNLISTYNTMPDRTVEERKRKVARRNQILQELISLVDQNYADFEARYYGSDASVNFAGDVVNLGLTGVSSVTGTAHLKSVLSAIATGTTGIKTSFLKNYYDQQTRGAVVQKMRAGRATALADLQDEHHMKAGPGDYSLESGLSDIAAYYNAGTVIGALQSIAETAGTQHSDAQEKQAENSKQPQSFK